MSLQLQMAIEGNLTAFMQAQSKGVARAVTGAVRVVTFGLQREIKRQIKRAKFAKPGLERLVFSEVHPKRGYRPDANGVVYTHADVKRRSGKVNLIETYASGTVITAQSGHWLAIPTEHAPFSAARGRTQTRATPKESGLPLVARPTKNPKLAMLVKKSDKGPKFTVYYWLVPQVSIRKRFDIDAAKNKWLPQLEPKMNKNFDHISAQIGVPL